MLEFLKAPFLVPHFSYYTLMTFLTILSLILVTACNHHLICSNSIWYGATTWIGFWTWIWSTKTLWTGQRIGLLTSMLGKLNCFPLTNLKTLNLLIWKWMGLFLRQSHLLRCWGWSSLLNWIGTLTLSSPLLKLSPRKFES